MPTVINYLTTIHFGSGAILELPAILKQLGILRPLLVTDTGLLQTGIPDRLQIPTATQFADVESNPEESSVMRGVDVYRQGRCDGIVAVGGGSPIDCAKCIGLLTTHVPPIENYAAIKGGLTKISASKPPLVAVPTTSGTGSEVGRAALVTTQAGEKLGIISPYMIPTAAICDPDLTHELPPQLTAATGMDAISHCVETFCSPRYNPVADAIALDGLERATKSIRHAVSDGHNAHHRNEMMMASLQGGLTFQKGLGMIHSLSHPLGGLKTKRLHHGTLNAIFLPHVLRFNMLSCLEKMERMAVALGRPDAATLSELFQDLIVDVGLPVTLSEIGLEKSDFKGIAAAALRDHSTECNPRKMTEADCEQLLHDAL